MIDGIREKIRSGGAIDREEALALFMQSELTVLGMLADGVRRRLHPGKTVTFVVDRNVNYTNVCVSRCRFCAFYRDAGSPDAYLLSRDEIVRKIGELRDQGGTQLLMQGGLHPGLDICFFVGLVQGYQGPVSGDYHPFPFSCGNSPYCGSFRSDHG